MGELALVVVLLLFARLLGVLRDWERGRTRLALPIPWWFGYARDCVNFVGFAGLTAGFSILGVSPPVAFLIAFVYWLVIYALDYRLSHRRGMRPADGTVQLAWTAILSLLLLAPTVARIGPLARGLASAVDALFGVAPAR